MRSIKSWLPYKIAREIKNSIREISFHTLSVINRMPSVMKDLLFDRELGIETSAYSQYPDNSLYKDMIPYVPMSYDKIEKILDHLKSLSNDVFVDIGCGKGRVVFSAAARNIKKAVGIELSEGLISIARDNLRTARKLNSPVELVNADAVTMRIDDGTVFFLYHPFGHNTMKKVVERLKESVAAKPRKLRIVYVLPHYRYIFDDTDWLELESELDGGDVVIWRTKRC